MALVALRALRHTLTLTPTHHGNRAIGIEMSPTNTLFTILALASATASAAPRFEDFPAPAHQSTRPAINVQIHGERSRMFATRLRMAARQPVNFSGHYILALWGCGASCVMGAAIDARTGFVSWIPHTICCWNDKVEEPLAYRRNSRLFIAHGSLDEKGPGNAVHYYDFNGGRFVPLPSSR